MHIKLKENWVVRDGSIYTTSGKAIAFNVSSVAQYIADMHNEYLNYNGIPVRQSTTDASNTHSS